MLPDETIELPPRRAEATLAPGLPDAAPEVGDRLLRQRIGVIALMILAGLFLWLVRTSLSPEIGYPSILVLASAAIATLAILVWSRIRLTRRQLRAIEGAILVVTTTELLVRATLLIGGRLEAGQRMLAFAELYNTVFATGALVLLYGILIPNPWWRALLVAGPVAASPAFIVLLLGRWMPSGPDLLREVAHPEIAVDLGMAMLVSLAVAVAGAHAMYALERFAAEARELGHYRLQERIGGGGMGEIWLARHRFLARPAAVKVISPEKIDPLNPDAAAVVLKRFEHEARTTAMLESMHTVRIYDFGRTERGDFYYAMEMLRGLDLDTLVRRYGAIGPARTIHFLRQACESLSEAHARGQVHRDVKPSNLFACQVGLTLDVLKVLDFGLVTRAGSAPERDLRLTEGEGLAGTPAYMAPEQVLAASRIDTRADLYSLGCVGYWLLTGHTVFDIDRPIAMAVAHVKAAPLRPSRRTELPIPEDLEEIILRCLRKEPDERPASAEELAELLAACADAGGWRQADARRWWAEHRPTEREAPPGAGAAV